MVLAGVLSVTVAHADEAGRPPVHLELGACLELVRSDVQRAVRVELGEATEVGGSADASAVLVRVDCAAEGLDAGVVLEVRRPGGGRRYRYALDWRAQPLDARPRLVGLAVAEAVDASRIELTAIAEPAPPPALRPPAIAAPPSPWSFAVVLDQRAFSASEGVTLFGLGLVPARRLTHRLRFAADVLVEGSTTLTGSGAVVVRTLSTAPRVVYRVGDRVHGELGLGVRVGVARIRGEALASSALAGQSLVRAWLGPVATVAAGVELTASVGLTASLELGRTVTDVAARDLGQPVARLGGAWTSVGLGLVVAL